MNAYAQLTAQAHTIRHAAPDGSGEYDEVVAGGETVGHTFPAYSQAGRAVIVAQLRGGKRLGEYKTSADAVLAVLAAA